jgi:hypothetical protein
LCRTLLFSVSKLFLFRAPRIFATDTKIWLLNDAHVLLRNIALSVCKSKKFYANFTVSHILHWSFQRMP